MQKKIGLSLEEITRILHDELTADELRGMLKAQLVLTESAIETAQLRRERILARLQYFDLENNMPTYEVTLKSVEAHTIAAIREIVPTIEQMPPHLRDKFQTIANWMIANNLPFGHPMTIYHDESYTRENIDTECAFTINKTEINDVASPASPIVIRRIEAVPQVATTIVAGGNSENFKLAYNTLGHWIANHSYHIVGPPRELYYGSPEQGEYTAEIQFPVEKGEQSSIQ